MKSVPNRPAISNMLIKANANVAFRARLLTRPQEVLAEMNLPPEDIELLANVQAPTLPEYARQVKIRLMAQQRRSRQRPIEARQMNGNHFRGVAVFAG